MEKHRAQTSAAIDIAAASALHFMVDSLCVCSLYLITSSPANYLAYNVVAFLSQPLAGHLADRMARPSRLLLAFPLLLCLGALISVLAPSAALAAAIALGAGNSLFHVWGGIRVARLSRNDPRALGIYVAPGALGLAAGAILAGWAYLCALVAAICALSTIIYCRSQACETAQEPSAPQKRRWIIIVALIMLYVMYRSLAAARLTAIAGSVNPSPLLAGLVATLGKALGGFAFRNSRAPLIFVLATAISAACMATGGTAAAFIGLFAVSATMPATLCWASKAAGPGRYGLIFGLLAAALVPPYLAAALCR